MAVDRVFDVLIVGGGNAGISAAATLIRKGIRGVAVIESQSVHTYRPLLSYVGGGEANQRDAERTQRSVTPRGCTWIRDPAVAVDPARAGVLCASGDEYRYRDLVIATGLVPDDDALPGIDTALRSPAVASNYLDRAEQTWSLVEKMPSGGRAVFTVPRAPVSCTGTTIKPVLLATGYWHHRRVEVDITLVLDRPQYLGVPALDDELAKQLQRFGVRVLHGTRVTALQPDAQTITVSGDGTNDQLLYDMLHLVPPFRGPPWLQSSGLTDHAHGLVDVDPLTLRHRAHANVWAAGDVATVDTDPSGGALRRQIKILTDNLLAARRGHRLDTYDGYTVAPIATDAHHLVAGEFDRTGAIASSLPGFIDSTKPRVSAWAFDRYVLPQVYWHLILKGRA